MNTTPQGPAQSNPRIYVLKLFPPAAPAAQPQPAVLPPRQPLPTAVLHPEKSALKLGLDVHLEFIMAVAQGDHASPQAPRKFTPDQLVEQVRKWIAQGLGEAAWRLLRDQPNYRLCKKWRARILDPQTPGGRKKQLVTALARGFGVDWWRLQTGQTTPEKLGLVMNEVKPSSKPPKSSSAKPSTRQ